MKIAKIHDNIHRVEVPFQSEGNNLALMYVYVVRGGRVALVDTGGADSPGEVLQPALAELGLDLSRVDLILNTHHHMDHAGGNRETKRASNALIHLHSDDLWMAESVEAQVEFLTASYRALGFPLEMMERRKEYAVRVTGDAIGADVLLADGDKVDLGAGIELTVIHCPGHTPGSVSYYWEKEGVLMTGDAIQCHGSRIGGYPLYFNAGDYRRSITRLMEVPFRLFCQGHAFNGCVGINDPTRMGSDGMAFLKESARVADSIHSAVAEALRQTPDASKRDIALAALKELIYSVPQLLLRETGMPSSAGPTLFAHIEAALDGSYPT